MNTEQNIIDFSATLIAGSVKSAMKDAKATSRDLWNVGVEEIRILDNFNVRVRDDAHRAHIRTLANSIKTEGFFADKPLSGYVAREGDVQVIYVTDGHCRFEAALLAISEGAEITRLPVVVSAQGTSLEDLTVALVKSNSGKPLSPYEVAMVCKRLSRFGWDTTQIATRLDLTEVYVDGLLMLVSAPKEVRDMVQNGQVSATTAIQAIRVQGSAVVEHLQSALGRAVSMGAKRITAKHLPGDMFKKDVKKAAPKLFDLLLDVKSDNGYQHISPELREKLEQLMMPLQATKVGGETAPQ